MHSAYEAQSSSSSSSSSPSLSRSELSLIAANPPVLFRRLAVFAFLPLALTPFRLLPTLPRFFAVGSASPALALLDARAQAVPRKSCVWFKNQAHIQNMYNQSLLRLI